MWCNDSNRDAPYMVQQQRPRYTLHSATTVTMIVTTKTATPTKVDSKLSDVHLESLKRREVEERMPLRPRVESSTVRLHKRFYLVNTGQNGTLFILPSSKHR